MLPERRDGRRHGQGKPVKAWGTSGWRFARASPLPRWRYDGWPRRARWAVPTCAVALTDCHQRPRTQVRLIMRRIGATTISTETRSGTTTRNWSPARRATCAVPLSSERSDPSTAGSSRSPVGTPWREFTALMPAMSRRTTSPVCAPASAEAITAAALRRAACACAYASSRDQSGLGLINVSADNPGLLLIGREATSLQRTGSAGNNSRDKQMCAYARTTGWCEVQNPRLRELNERDILMKSGHSSMVISRPSPHDFDH
jgi:hypothetical protein